MFAPMSAAVSFSRSAAILAPHAPTTAPASAALAKVEDIDTTLARRFARERLEALQAGSSQPSAGKTRRRRRRGRARSR